MDVFIISGPSGSGKTTLIKFLESRYQDIGINYRDCKYSDKKPTSLISKVDYTRKWYDRIKQLYFLNIRTVISDRSPLDNLAYLSEFKIEHSNQLNSELTELESLEINFYTILISAEFDILAQRIINRNRCKELHNISYQDELDLLPSSIQYFESESFIRDFKIDTGETLEEDVQRIALKFIQKITISNTIHADHASG